MKQGWLRRTACLCLSLAALAPLQATAQEAADKTVDLPVELHETARRDFEAAACFESDQPPLQQQITTQEMVLTTTTGPALLVTGMPPCLAFQGNSPYLLYARFGNNWRNILRANGSVIRALPSMSVGWNELAVLYRKSSCQSTRPLYGFRKTAYVETACGEGIVCREGNQTPLDKPEYKPCGSGSPPSGIKSK